MHLQLPLYLLVIVTKMSETERLFKGLTRPAMLYGVPIVPLFMVFATIFLVAVWTNMFVNAALVPAFIILRAVAKKDEFIFHLLFLQMKLFTPTLNKKFYGAKTFSPVDYRKLPDVGLPKLSTLGLDKDPTFTKYIPYEILFNDLVMTKDFMLMATWKIEGVPFEVEDVMDLVVNKNTLNMIFKTFANDPISFYFHNVRHGIEDKFTSNFDNLFLKEMDEKYYNGYKKNTLKKNTMFFTMIYDPISQKVEKSSFKKRDFETKQKEIKSFISRMNEHCARLESNLKTFLPQRLGIYEKDGYQYSNQLEFYNYLIGNKFMPMMALNSPIFNYLKGGVKNIMFNNDTVQINYNDDTKRFARSIEILDYTNETFAGILDGLLYLKLDYTITQSFSPLAKIDGRDALNKQRKQLKSAEDDSQTQLNELETALDELASGELCFGEYHFTLTVFGSSVKEAKDNANEVITTLNEIGFSSTLATRALPANYFSQFPSNFALRTRVAHLSSKNYSSLIALHNFSKGKRDGNAWGEAITMLKTPNGQPYYFNFHETSLKDDFGDFPLGNGLIVGQSGGGKTVLMSFLFNQLQKYADPLTFPQNTPDNKKNATLVYLDKDKGALANILAIGGRYMTIESGTPTGFNPFMCDTTPNNIRELQNLIHILVTRKGEILTTAEEQQLNAAVESVMTQFEKEERKYGISLVLEHLTENINDQNSLKSRLSLWQHGNKFGWVLDNEYDQFNFPNDIRAFGIDGTEFLEDKDVGAPISYYIFWRIKELIDGRRFVLFIDECWQWIDDLIVAEEVKNKEKTIRKQNGIIVMATQSPEDLLRSPIAAAIIEQSATLIFLPNPKAKEEDYIKGFNLTMDEYEIIKTFDPTKRNFLIKKGKEKTIVTLDLASLGDVNLKILSTSTSNIEMIENIFASNKSFIAKYNELKSKLE